jgi:hypothetical protein
VGQGEREPPRESQAPGARSQGYRI